jgi:Ca2+-binding RTX toxin-like protein
LCRNDPWWILQRNGHGW